MINIFIINILWKGIISCLWVHAGARTDVGEKKIKIRCVTVHVSSSDILGGIREMR
jgi:hypothetical protein